MSKYTVKEIANFVAWCNHHGIKFNTRGEFNAAIEQYYLKD